jgi:hypothetical protein
MILSNKYSESVQPANKLTESVQLPGINKEAERRTADTNRDANGDHGPISGLIPEEVYALLTKIINPLEPSKGGEKGPTKFESQKSNTSIKKKGALNPPKMQDRGRGIDTW